MLINSTTFQKTKTCLSLSLLSPKPLQTLRCTVESLAMREAQPRTLSPKASDAAASAAHAPYFQLCAAPLGYHVIIQR